MYPQRIWARQGAAHYHYRRLQYAEDDINKAVKEAAEFEAQDKKKKEAIDTRNSADSFVFQTEKALADVGDKIDAGQKAGVEADLNALKSLLESTKDFGAFRQSGSRHQGGAGEADAVRTGSVCKGL